MLDIRYAKEFQNIFNKFELMFSFSEIIFDNFLHEIKITFLDEWMAFMHGERRR